MYRFTMPLVGVLVCGVLALSPVQAASERPYLGLMGTYLEPSEVREASGDGPGASLYFGLPLQRFPGWSVEVLGAWNEIERDAGTGQDQLYHLGLDLLREFSWTDSLRPYAMTGLSWAYEDVLGDTSSRPAVALGGGVLWQTGFAPLRVRLDARALAQENDYQNAGLPTSGRTLLVDGRFGLGLSYALGSSRCEGSDCEQDADGDGVGDAQDLCPDSLPDAQVDRTGCEAVAHLDSDGDGVMDAADQCPGTPPGTRVDVQGCGEQAEVVLQGVNFEFDSDRLTASAQEVLRPIAGLLQGGLAAIRVEIAGHTDAVGTDDYNQALSARRAYAVKQFLISQGVSASRLIATGYGSSRPVASNDTAEDRARNRRVVFRVLE